MTRAWLWVWVGFAASGCATASAGWLRTTPIGPPPCGGTSCAWRPPQHRLELPEGGRVEIGISEGLGAGYHRCRYTGKAEWSILPGRAIALRLVPPPPDEKHFGICRAVPRMGGIARLELAKGTWTIDAGQALVGSVRLVP